MVGVVLEKWLQENQSRTLIDEAKDIFPGAAIESIVKGKVLIDDEVPF